METGLRRARTDPRTNDSPSAAGPLAGAPGLENQREAEPPRLQVECVEPVSGWLRRLWGELDFAGVDVELVTADEALHATGSPGPVPRILHLGAWHLQRLHRFRKAAPGSRLVLDLTGPGDAILGRRAARRAALADLLLVGSLAELRELRRCRPHLMRSSAFVRPPIDLDRHAPESALRGTREAELVELRDRYRLEGPFVLYHGPVNSSSGVDLAIEALGVAQTPEAKLVLLPEAEVDPRFLERCGLRAAALRRPLVVAPASDDELPLWYALATVVCSPSREAPSAEPAMLAGAAACPFVGGESPVVLEYVKEAETGYVVRAGEVHELAKVLETLLTDEAERKRLGDAGRRLAESQLNSATAAQRLASLWRQAAGISADASRDRPHEIDLGVA